MDIIKLCRVLHLFFLIVWLGSLCVLPMLILNSLKDRSTIKRLYKTRQMPAMILALSFGVILFCLLPKQVHAGWFHMKMTGVIALVVLDILLAKELFAREIKTKKVRFVQVLTPFVIFFILVSIYCIRNKDAEAKKSIGLQAQVGFVNLSDSR